MKFALVIYLIYSEKITKSDEGGIEQDIYLSYS